MPAVTLDWPERHQTRSHSMSTQSSVISSSASAIRTTFVQSSSRAAAARFCGRRRPRDHRRARPRGRGPAARVYAHDRRGPPRHALVPAADRRRRQRRRRRRRRGDRARGRPADRGALGDVRVPLHEGRARRRRHGRRLSPASGHWPQARRSSSCSATASTPRPRTATASPRGSSTTRTSSPRQRRSPRGSRPGRGSRTPTRSCSSRVSSTST